jgi:hypothetical protein
MCVSVPRGLVVVSDYDAYELHMYSMIDGTRIRTVGSKGSGKRHFHFGYGGLCVSLDGDSVLVADTYNMRVQEVRIVDGSWVRFVGIGVLEKPQCVDCNADVIAVSEWACHRISVLSWADGSVRARFGSFGSQPGHFRYPRGVRLLANGSEVVVADCDNHRLCVFTLSGEFVAAMGNREQGLNYPYNVLECAPDGSYIATNIDGNNLIKLSRDNAMAEVFGKYGDGDGEFSASTALVALPNDGCLVVDYGNRRVQYFARLRARLSWMRACACSTV